MLTSYQFRKRIIVAKLGLTEEELRIVLDLIKRNGIRTKQELTKALTFFMEYYSQEREWKRGDVYHEVYDLAQRAKFKPIIDKIRRLKE